MKAKETISLFDDVLFSPISIWDFISEINFLVNKSSYKHKIFHLAAVEAISKYEFGKLLIKSLSLDLSYIKKG